MDDEIKKRIIDNSTKRIRDEMKIPDEILKDLEWQENFLSSESANTFGTSTSSNLNSEPLTEESLKETIQKFRETESKYKKDLIEAICVYSKLLRFVAKVTHEEKNYIIIGTADYHDLLKLAEKNKQYHENIPQIGILPSLSGIPIIKDDAFVEILLVKNNLSMGGYVTDKDAFKLTRGHNFWIATQKFFDNGSS